MRDFIELNRIRGLSPRQQRLLALEAVYEGTQYAGLRPWRPGVQQVNGVDTPIPCDDREPVIMAGLAHEKATKLLDMLVGEGRLPKIGGLSDDLTTVLKDDFDLGEALFLPMLDLIVKGSGCLGFVRLDGTRFEPIYLDPTWCEPVMVSQARGTRAQQIADELTALGVRLPRPAGGRGLAIPEGAWRDDLVFLRHEWVYEEQVADGHGGQPGTSIIWRRRRDYLPDVILEYEDVRILSTTTVAPKWQLREKPRPHNWGTVPLVWVRNRGARPDEWDGPSFFTPFLLSLDKASDRTESLKDDAVIAAAWPQLTEIDVRNIHADINAANGLVDHQSSSSSEVLQYRSIGPSPSVSYLEQDGTGVEVARKHLEDIDKRAARVTGIVDVDDVEGGGALSGTALERRMEPTVAKVNAYRARMGELIRVLIDKLGRVAGEDTSELRLQWPRVIPPTPEETAQTAVALSTAAGGMPVMSQQTAVEAFAAMAGLDSADDELKRLEEAADGQLARMREAMDRQPDADAGA